VLTLRPRPAAWGAAAVVALLLVGCSSEDDALEVDRSRSCDLYLRDQGVSVRFAGAGSRRACTEWLARRAGPWSRGAGSDADTSFERVCVVFRSSTGAALYATGKPGSYGEAEGVCDTLEGEGWNDLNPPKTETSRREPVPEPSRFEPVRCAEGRCFQGDTEVAQPSEGGDCGEGAWTYVGVSRDGLAGVYRCLTDPDPGSPVTCDSFGERCTQGRWAVRQPEPGAACGAGDRRWEEVPTSDAATVYRCVSPAG
jgi:hypothetical protein